MSRYVGVDLHRRRCQVVILDEDGEMTLDQESQFHARHVVIVAAHDHCLVHIDTIAERRVWSPTLVDRAICVLANDRPGPNRC